MKVTLKKDKFEVIDNAFLVLKEDPDNTTAVSLIKMSLEECFGAKFNITIVKSIDATRPDNTPFIMSVFPEVSTIDKIISALISNDDNTDGTVKSLWDKNKVWNIEIDRRILDTTIADFTKRELTALLMHEIGHVACSNSITSRLTTILQYELAKINMKDKLLLRDKIFRQVLSLPVLNACIMDDKRSGKNIKEEIKADSFSKKMGYGSDLASVMKKIMDSGKCMKSGTIDDNLRSVTSFSTNTLTQLRERQSNLVRNNLTALKVECVSPFITDAIGVFESALFEYECNSSSIEKSKIEYMMEKAERICSDEEIITEFFSFGQKQLKKIDPAELDYIDVKINEIKSESDKMMLISYLYSKLDMIDYYINILENPKLSTKYNIPHTLEQLKAMKKRLMTTRENILAYKIPDKMKGILVAWPDNYEG